MRRRGEERRCDEERPGGEEVTSRDGEVSSGELRKADAVRSSREATTRDGEERVQ